jgi:sarcosine oxidase subunit alpha
MKNRLQFGTRRLEVARGPAVQIDFEGKPITAFVGEPVGVSLLAAGVGVLSRSIKFHRPRGLFCLSGDCGACLMRIDGQPNQRACRVLVHEGLSCSRQNAWPSAGFDILSAADEMFPDGMDHHTLMTAPRPLNLAMQQVVQRLGGLGKLPDAEPPFDALPAGQSRHVAALVVGSGPAGLAAAHAIAKARRSSSGPVLVVEAAPHAGGSYLCDPRFGPAAAEAALSAAHAAGVEVWVRRRWLLPRRDRAACDCARLRRCLEDGWSLQGHGRSLRLCDGRTRTESALRR